MQTLLAHYPWLANPWIMTLLIIWVVAWKGTALWKAARNNSKPWFIALLVVNTVGILEMIYFFFVLAKRKKLKK